MWGKPDGFVEIAQRPRTVGGLQDFRGVIHCHSFRSHDSTGTIAEIGAAANDVGLDFLVMTDHPSPYSISRGQRGMVGSTLFLTGAELRTPGGTLLAFPLRHYVRPHETLRGFLDDIHGQGGLAFVGHAERFKAWDHPGLDGVEVHNMHAAARAANVAGLVVRTFFAPLHTMFAALAVPDREVFARWDGYQRGVRMIPAIAGNDAHANIRLLGPLGWVLGNYAEVFRVVSTHVLASSLDEAALVDGFRRGRTYVSIDLWGDGTGFSFSGRFQERTYEMGDVVPRTSRLSVHSPRCGELRLFRNGELVAQREGHDLERTIVDPGVYRAEVWRDGQLWIFSSPIRVE